MKWLQLLILLVTFAGVSSYSSIMLCSSHRRAVRFLASSSSSIDASLTQGRKAELLEALRSIIDPETGTSIIDSGRLSEVSVEANGDVRLQLSAKSSRSLVADELKKLCLLQASMLDWIAGLSINLAVITAMKPPSEPAATIRGVSAVKEIVAVSSGKGGVGKVRMHDTIISANCNRDRSRQWPSTWPIR
jgi:metal-sulfur cluster biosynthetic enzyme